MVDDTFAQDVEKALLLSKLDFEEQKATNKIMDEERIRLAVLEASKKPKTMSLGQFHQAEPDKNCDSVLQIPCDIKERTDYVTKKPFIIDKKDASLTNGNKKQHDNFESSPDIDNEHFFTNLHQDTLNLINHEKKQHTTRNMSVVSQMKIYIMNFGRKEENHFEIMIYSLFPSSKYDISYLDKKWSCFERKCIDEAIQRHCDHEGHRNC